LLVRNPPGLVRASWRRGFRIITDFPEDIRHGIHTGLLRPKFGDEAKEIHVYEPAPYATLRDVRRHMLSSGTLARTFIDVGTGWGRPLYYFSDLFDELQGFEINPIIFQSSKDQLERIQSAKGRTAYKRIAIRLMDATLETPLDRDLVLFLYNPFGPTQMRALCNRLKRSRGHQTIYYVNPVYAQVIEQELGVAGTVFSKFMKVNHYFIPARTDDGAGGKS